MYAIKSKPCQFAEIIHWVKTQNMFLEFLGDSSFIILGAFKLEQNIIWVILQTKEGMLRF